MPPRPPASFRAWSKASTTWVGEVKRHLPPPSSIPFHWSRGPGTGSGPGLLQAASFSRLARMKEKPGTPWMHLLALETRKSIPQSARGMSMPPKVDMASTMKVLLGGLGHLAHRGHVVEDAAGGLPVDHGHVGDGGVLRQILGHHATSGRWSLGCS